MKEFRLTKSWTQKYEDTENINYSYNITWNDLWVQLNSSLASINSALGRRYIRIERDRKIN